LANDFRSVGQKLGKRFHLQAAKEKLCAVRLQGASEIGLGTNMSSATRSTADGAAGIEVQADMTW
jgi:hypothetical protein